MMWIVRLALQRPYTFVVMSMLIVILGVVTILRMPTDIFPDIDIPVISVVWHVQRPVARGDGEAHRQQLRAQRSRRRSTTSSTSRARRSPASRSSRSSSSRAPSIEAATAQVTAISQTALAADAAGHDAAAHHPVQRVERAHPAARARERHASASSSCSTTARTSSAPTSRPSRARRSPALRRQAAPGHDRHRPAAALRAGACRRAT